jgi:predicted small secreted protein
MKMTILAVAAFVIVSLPLAAHAQGTTRGAEEGSPQPAPSSSNSPNVDDVSKGPKPSSSMSSIVDDVSTWTSKQLDWAKAEWAKEKEKWADCQRQSQDQNLTGPKSWSFLASCMSS